MPYPMSKEAIQAIVESDERRRKAREALQAAQGPLQASVRDRWYMRIGKYAITLAAIAVAASAAMLAWGICC